MSSIDRFFVAVGPDGRIVGFPRRTRPLAEHAAAQTFGRWVDVREVSIVEWRRTPLNAVVRGETR